MLAPAFEVFCGVFALLAYRTLFHSDRSISVGSMIMLISLAAAITQLFTSSSLDMGVVSSVSSVFQGKGTGVSGDSDDPGGPAHETGKRAHPGTGSADTTDTTDPVGVSEFTDFKTEVVGQIVKMCAGNENAGYLASFACKQLF